MKKDNSIRFALALPVAKGLNKLIDIVDNKRGSNFAGEKAMLIDPNMIAHFQNIDPDKVIFITGTNGKSTTTNLVTHILRENGYKVVSNLEGANLLAGLATSLAKESDSKGRLEADYFVFETDERFLPLIYEQLPAKHILITNLQKDQVQRNGDPDFILRKLESFANGDIHYYLNSEEPRTKAFERFSDNVTTFGIARHENSYTKDQSYPTEACPKCGHTIKFDYYNVDGVGPFHCDNCGFSSDENPDYWIDGYDRKRGTLRINGVEGKIPLDMPVMFYNYAAAAALCMDIAGLTAEDIFKTLPTFKNIGGRYESFTYKGNTIKYLRMKQENPDTLQNALNIIAEDTGKKSLFIGLHPVEDIIPGYTNTFYTYDCDFSRLIDSGVDHYYCFSPVVCFDSALRLLYEGVDQEDIIVEEVNDPELILKRIEDDENNNIYLITLLYYYEKLKNLAAQKEAEDE